MTDAARAAAALRQAAELNLADPLRRGSLLCFPNYGQLVMTGDLHGHRRNFDKLRTYCDLEHSGARHVILHEIIHEEVESVEGLDGSHALLVEAAEWKCRFPDQVHFLQSNHELSQLNRAEISKNGRVVTQHFELSVREAYGGHAGEVVAAIDSFIRSLPLAGRTENRVFLSHSLPGPRALARFDRDVLHRLPTDADLAEQGPAYQLVWGRYQTAEVLHTLAALLDVDLFLCGHQPQETGFDVLCDRMIILSSEHNHGVFLPFDLSKPAVLERLVASIRPFAGVV
jgi:serine/threonine-protein phosphatase PP1 catalytic subunit